MAKRTKITNADEHYQALQTLEKLVAMLPRLTPDRNRWDVEGDWTATGDIIFLDGIHQPLFEPFHPYVFRTFKLINYGRPAARLTFFKKHRYYLIKPDGVIGDHKRNVVGLLLGDTERKIGTLTNKLHKVSSPEERSALLGQIGRLNEQLMSWRAIRDDLDAYEIALSNYQRKHMYLTVNFKYRQEGEVEYSNGQEHLLNTQKDRADNVIEVRQNVIFIDMNEIYREHPYQNKEIENYLATYPLSSEGGQQQLYARRRVKISFDETSESESALD